MGLGKTYSTKYLLDSNNSSGAAGQVLISTATGVNWSDGTDIIGGPYLPLAGGTLTGDLTVDGASITIDTDTAGSSLTWRESDSSTTAGQLRGYANRGDIYLYASGVKKTEISASTDYGTESITKQDLLKQLGAVLAFVSLHSKDSVGLVLFSDIIEKVIPPRNSRQHTLSLVQTLFSTDAHNKKTNLAVPLEYIARLRGQKALVCFLSDFMAPLNEAALSLVSRRHDVMAFRCLDPRERQFPHVGTLTMQDCETQVQVPIAGQLNGALTRWHKKQQEQLIAARIDLLDCQVGTSFTGPLLRFLRHRMY